MSVINRMLQDLQSRKAPLAGSPDLVVAPPFARASGTRRLGALLLGGTALIAAAAYAPWPAMNAASAAHLAPPTVVSAAAPTAPVTSNALTTTLSLRLVSQLASPQASAPAPSPIAHPVKAEAEAKLKPAPSASAEPRAPADVAASGPALASAGTGTGTEMATVTGTVDKRLRAESPRQRAEIAHRQSVDLAAAGQVRQALDLAREALQADPSHAPSRQLAVSLLIEQQRFAEAEALARAGLALSGPHEPLATLLARMLSEQGHKDAALDVLDQQASLSAEGLGLRAGLLAQAGNFKRAALDYQRAVQQQPDNSLWWLGLGVALEAVGPAQDARRAYAKAQSLGMERADLTAFIDQKLRTLN
ncbi:MAG: tetratricopeptide repeat protein [Burkholderiales bacterium]|nr:tetratricopeptide repeat protein [Burkholderiales bacterium]